MRIIVIYPLFPLIIDVEQLQTMRKFIDTASDLNTVFMSKLNKIDGIAQNLVAASTKLESRAQSIENEWKVHPLTARLTRNFQNILEKLVSPSRIVY